VSGPPTHPASTLRVAAKYWKWHGVWLCLCLYDRDLPDSLPRPGCFLSDSPTPARIPNCLTTRYGSLTLLGKLPMNTVNQLVPIPTGEPSRTRLSFECGRWPTLYFVQRLTVGVKMQESTNGAERLRQVVRPPPNVSLTTPQETHSAEYGPPGDPSAKVPAPRQVSCSRQNRNC
jgi:hypothetical protein